MLSLRRSVLTAARTAQVPVARQSRQYADVKGPDLSQYPKEVQAKLIEDIRLGQKIQLLLKEAKKLDNSGDPAARRDIPQLLRQVHSTLREREQLLPLSHKEPKTLPTGAHHEAHHDAHHDAHHGPVKESFGPKFYIGIASIPALLGLYYVSRSDGDERPLLTRFIGSWSVYREYWATTNDLHVQALEQAGRDRNLFYHSKGQQTVDMKFPELIGVASPYNVPAGSGVNLDKLIAKYEKENYGAEAAKLQALKDGTLPAEQED